jgi:hypothetical protein
LTHRMKLRQVMVEVLVPWAEKQPQRIDSSMGFAQAVIRERAQRVTDLCKDDVARMAPRPCRGKQ